MSNIDNSSFSTYYVFQSTGKLLAPLTVVMAGDEQCASTYCIQRMRAEIGVLIYVAQGAGVLDCQGKIYHLQAGDMIALPQGTSYRYWAEKQMPWRIMWFNLTGALYPALLKQYDLQEKPCYTDVGVNIAELFWQAMQLCRASLSREQVQDSLCAKVYEILLLLWRKNLSPTKAAGVPQQLRDYLQEMLAANPAQKLFLEQAARCVGMSVRQMERLFHQQYGYTPYAYFQQQKLALSKQYLQYTPLSIKEISTLLGFCDPYYFSNCFKRSEGISPQQYRAERK